MKRFFKRPLFICFLFLSSCGGSDNISMIKDIVMPGYPDMTIGQALEAAFDDPLWKSAVLINGKVQVAFEGKISQATHDLAVSEYLRRGGGNDSNPAYLDEIWPVGSQALFVWSHARDEEVFTLIEVVNEYWNHNAVPTVTIWNIVHRSGD
ncbi:MAG: hypothetical protein LBJ14_09575 [Desulfarculales bacterium]|jgi:hypothetical protein|nr:hypothetical protein [Desulfarculales bacterium]